MSVSEAALLTISLLEMAETHLKGGPIHLHPSSVRSVGGSLALSSAPAQSAKDLACYAPELKPTVGAMDAKGVVYAAGCIFYEALTGKSVAPGMKRPREARPDAPELAEVILGRALIVVPQKRPDDLSALRAALHSLIGAGGAAAASGRQPQTSIPPEGYDISLSVAPPEVAEPNAFSLPPAAANPAPAWNDLPPSGPNAPPSSRAAGIPQAPLSAPVSSRAVVNATAELAQLKAQLEADTSPRYVVIKDKMDHGPFSAVELLQQIASSTFKGHADLRDEKTGETRPIQDWPQFAPFAEHAKMKREVVAEAKAVVRLEQKEKSAGVVKYVVGALIASSLVAAGVVWFVQHKGSRGDGKDLADDPSAIDLSVGGGLKGQKKPQAGGSSGGGGAGGGGGGVHFGMSYEAALNANNEEIKMGNAPGGPDLSNAQLSAPMANGSYISACGAPGDMKVTVRVAVKMGRAMGVSVYTVPPNPAVAGCVDRHVRGLSWPAHPKMDSFTTTY